MDSLQDIMGGRQFMQPDEVGALQDYIKHHYNIGVRVVTEKDAYIVYVPGSAAASTLQMNKHHVERGCSLKRRLVIRVGR